MLIYFGLLLVVTLSVYLSQKTKDPAVLFLLRSVTFASPVLVGGLRNRFVGTDSGYYILTFERITTLADAWNAGVEPGVPLLCWLSKFIANDYAVMFTLVAVITTFCFLRGIRKLSIDPVVSVFVLLASGIYYFSFNGTRQGIAIALCFLAIGFVYYRKLWAFLVCVAVACFFHASAIVVAPAYFVVPRKNDFRYNAFIFVLVVICGLFFSELVALAGRLNPRYLEYGAEAGRGPGLVYAASLIFFGLFFLYFRTYVQPQHRPRYDFLLNLYLLGLAVTVVGIARATGPSGVSRMNAYFIPSQILLWPIVLANLHRYRYRAAVRIGFVILFLVYHGVLVTRFSNLVPYSYNPLFRRLLATVL